MSLVRDKRGAVYVEFLAAVMPLIVTFLCIAQLADLYAAKLVAQHAAYRTARAGAVVFPDNPAYYQAVSKADEVRRAGEMVLASKGTIIDSEILLPNGEQYTRGQLVEVEVRATTRCVFAIANRLVCGLVDPTRVLEARASMPAHAANYEYSE